MCIDTTHILQSVVVLEPTDPMHHTLRGCAHSDLLPVTVPSRVTCLLRDQTTDNRPAANHYASRAAAAQPRAHTAHFDDRQRPQQELWRSVARLHEKDLLGLTTTTVVEHDV